MKSEWKEMYVPAQVTAPQWTSTWSAGWKSLCHKAKRLSVDQYRESKKGTKIIQNYRWATNQAKCGWKHGHGLPMSERYEMEREGA